MGEEDITKDAVMKQFSFYDNNSIVRFKSPTACYGLMTNIMHIQVKANNSKINSVAQELNGLYDNVQNKRFELQQRYVSVKKSVNYRFIQ